MSPWLHCVWGGGGQLWIGVLYICMAAYAHIVSSDTCSKCMGLYGRGLN